MVTKLFSAGPKEFREWRLELGLSEEDMAMKAGVTVDKYKALESSRFAEVDDGGETYGRILVAFRGLGKEVMTAVDGHSTLQ